MVHHCFAAAKLESVEKQIQNIMWLFGRSLGSVKSSWFVKRFWTELYTKQRTQKWDRLQQKE